MPVVVRPPHVILVALLRKHRQHRARHITFDTLRASAVGWGEVGWGDCASSAPSLRPQSALTAPSLRPRYTLVTPSLRPSLYPHCTLLYPHLLENGEFIIVLVRRCQYRLESTLPHWSGEVRWRCGVWCGVVWCDVVQCGVVWCSVVWCGLLTWLEAGVVRIKTHKPVRKFGFRLGFGRGYL